ncbi:MAG: sulfurtransferase [Candidatus Dormibacteria bacterium]
MTGRRGLMTVMELARSLAEPVPPLVVDLRQDRDKIAPRVPGSVWADLHDGFAMRRPDATLNYDLPTPGEVASLLGRLGASPVSQIVFSDDMGNRWATRAYWVLRYYGHAGQVAVLDGGAKAWTEAGLPTVNDFAEPCATTYPVPSERDETIRATATQVNAALSLGTMTMCDVRTLDEYEGRVTMAARGGRIPGAIHQPWDRCLTPEGHLRPNHELEEILAPFLCSGGEPVTYCQGGIRASLVWFCINELLGQHARLYAGSWEEWGEDPSLPVEVGHLTL